MIIDYEIDEQVLNNFHLDLLNLFNFFFFRNSFSKKDFQL